MEKINMNITHVATGLINIPPNGWGAIERLIWEYKKQLDLLGHNVEIKYMNELEKHSNTIIHTHIFNQALHCKELGIPYIFSLHDHHAEYLGKDSRLFKGNLEAIKGSVISFTHAEYLIDFFDETDKLFYLSHGADTSFFTPNTDVIPHRLLMIANNGLAGDPTIDRKGFRQGIEAAKALDLPITIAGHQDNHKFFDYHRDLLEYDGLTIELYNPTDEQIRNLYQSHTIFVHPSFIEAGHPNLTLMEAASSCLPIVGTYRGSKHIYGMWVTPTTSTQDVIYGIEQTLATYDHRREEMFSVRESLDWKHVCTKLDKYYQNIVKINDLYTTDVTKEKYTSLYLNLV
jgi:glycosyltransferase involved in cell wall biosynthesis